MIEITGTVVGDKAVTARLSAMPAKVRQSVTEAMLRITINLGNHVRDNKLSGQLLKRRTGTLNRSIQERVLSTKDGVTGVVGSRVMSGAPLKYAYPLENGFDGDVPVREHLRTMTKAFGREVKEPRKITVRAHTAHRHVKAYKYLASSLAEKRDGYVEQLRRAVARGVRE